MERVAAIVVGAGSGERMGSDKIFAMLAGRPVIAWSLDVLQGCRAINEIILVLHKDKMETGKEMVDSWQELVGEGDIEDIKQVFQVYVEKMPDILKNFTNQPLLESLERKALDPKTRELVLARSIFADIAYSEYLYTYSHIGRIINRDHATVMHNIEILANDMRQRPELKYLRSQVFNKVKEFLQHS